LQLSWFVLTDGRYRAADLYVARFPNKFDPEINPGMKTLKFPLNASPSGWPALISMVCTRPSTNINDSLRYETIAAMSVRATAMSRAEGLRSKIALDLTTEWSFCQKMLKRWPNTSQQCFGCHLHANHSHLRGPSPITSETVTKSNVNLQKMNST